MISEYVATSPSSTIEKIVELVISEYRELDIAFNNAGIPGKPRTITKQSLEDWKFTQRTNLTSGFLDAEYQIPAMLKITDGSVFIKKHSVMVRMKGLRTLDQDQINYERIEKAINYIKTHFKDQSSLEEIAFAIHVSPFHFQRLFSQWAGINPKKFMQYLSLEYAKNILKHRNLTLMDTVRETRLSGTSHLHDLFVNIEGMTPGEYKSGAMGSL